MRNSGYLGLDIALSALTGVVTLSLLTRLYPVRAVGLSAAAVAATSLIASISQLGLNYSLVRFLPTTPRRRDLINSVLTVSGFVALIASAIFLCLPGTAKLYALGGVAFAAMFLLSTTLNTGTSLIQNVYVADRATRTTVRANMISSVAGLAAPAAFLFLGTAGAYMAQGVVPTVLDFAILAVVLARSGHRFRPMLNIDATRDLWRFSIGTYIAGLIGGVPLMALPLIILSRFGAVQNAYWYTAMAGASLLFFMPGAVSQALLAEAVHRPLERRVLVRKSAALVIAVMTPVLVFAYIAAPLGLALLGHHYEVDSLPILRLLIVAAAMTSLNYITGTILYLAKWTLPITVINALDAIIVLGLALVWAHDARDVAIAWVIGEVPNVVLFALFAMLSLRKVQWRWELLGEEPAEAKTHSGAQGYASRESQQAGLEMLLSLATHSTRMPLYELAKRPSSQNRRPLPTRPQSGEGTSGS